jgi:hypothetical protein
LHEDGTKTEAENFHSFLSSSLEFRITNEGLERESHTY